MKLSGIIAVNLQSIYKVTWLS